MLSLTEQLNDKKYFSVMFVVYVLPLHAIASIQNPTSQLKLDCKSLMCSQFRNISGSRQLASLIYLVQNLVLEIWYRSTTMFTMLMFFGVNLSVMFTNFGHIHSVIFIRSSWFGQVSIPQIFIEKTLIYLWLWHCVRIVIFSLIPTKTSVIHVS